MTGGLDEKRALIIGGVALGCNVVCLLVLLARPTGRFSPQLLVRLTRGCRVALAEAVGTFGLVFAVALALCGPGLAGEAPLPPAFLAAGLAQGLFLAAALVALGPSGGGQCNPALTLGLLLGGRGSWAGSSLRVLGQLSGALGAGSLVMWLLGPAAAAALPQPASALSYKAVFVLEAIGTFLVVVVFAVTWQRDELQAPLAVGLTVVSVSLALGPLTGAALNPVRYLALAVQAPSLPQVLIYVVGPCCGGSAAAVFVQLFLAPADPRPAQPAVEAERPERVEERQQAA